MHQVFPILALGFLTPWLMAAGAAATSIPIVIHLLNKRKFRIIVWAAMEWLLAAQRRNARRLRFQRWLLLALRCLAILVIAAGIAQLILQSSVVANILGEQRAVIILWDDSYSMGYQQDGDAAGAAPGRATAFEKSKRTISDLIGQLRSGDRVMVIRTSTGGPDAPEAVTGKPTPDLQSVIAQVNRTRLSDAATDLPGAFDRAAQVLNDLTSTTRIRQLILITDFSTSSIRDPQQISGASQDTRIQGVDGLRLKKSAEAAIAKATDFRMLPVGTADQSNLAVSGLTTRRPAVVAGVTTEMRVEVFNGTNRPALDQQVALLVDGIPAQTIKIPRIEPGSTNTAAAVVPVTFSTVGRHLVEARLPGDLLPVDDLRRLIVNVRKEIPVLLVDGSPNEGGTTGKGSTVFLYAAYALNADTTQGSMFAPKTITELELSTTPLSGYDVIVLSDTSVPLPPIRDGLKRFVEEGGLLIVFPGNRTNAAGMTETLGDNGAKLLPATLGQPMKLETPEQQQQGFKFAPEGYKHTVLSVFANDVGQGKNVGLDLVQHSQYLKLGVPVDGSVEVVLRYAKPDGTPGDAAVVKKDVGKGRVVLFATTAYASENGWNNWGAKPSFLPFMHELTHYSLGRQSAAAGAGMTLTVGSPIHLPAELASAGPWSGPRDVRVNVTREMDNQRAILISAPLTESGNYTPTAGGDGRPLVVVNPDTREADIRPIQPPQMAAALGVDPDRIITAPKLSDIMVVHSETGASWLGPWLVIAALLLFTAEAVCALAFSRYR